MHQQHWHKNMNSKFVFDFSLSTWSLQHLFEPHGGSRVIVLGIFNPEFNRDSVQVSVNVDPLQKPQFHILLNNIVFPLFTLASVFYLSSFFDFHIQGLYDGKWNFSHVTHFRRVFSHLTHFEKTWSMDLAVTLSYINDVVDVAKNTLLYLSSYWPCISPAKQSEILLLGKLHFL